MFPSSFVTGCIVFPNRYIMIILRINPIMGNVRLNELFANGASVWRNVATIICILSKSRMRAGIEVKSLVSASLNQGEKAMTRREASQAPANTTAAFFQAKTFP